MLTENALDLLLLAKQKLHPRDEFHQQLKKLSDDLTIVRVSEKITRVDVVWLIVISILLKQKLIILDDDFRMRNGIREPSGYREQNYH